jgi:hypothetical protein
MKGYGKLSKIKILVGQDIYKKLIQLINNSVFQFIKILNSLSSITLIIQFFNCMVNMSYREIESGIIKGGI